MSDHADKLRDILELTDCGRGHWEPLLDALVAERDEWEAALQTETLMSKTWRKEKVAAEAEVARLREALWKIAEIGNADANTDRLIARAALGEDA